MWSAFLVISDFVVCASRQRKQLRNEQRNAAFYVFRLLKQIELLYAVNILLRVSESAAIVLM